MTMLHDLAHYYREMEGTDSLSRTFESNEVLTPLQIPSRPTVSQDRYKKFRKSLHWCRLPCKTEREHGATALLTPEEHRPKNEPPCAFVKGHQHYGSAIDPWPRGLPIEQYYYVTQMKKSDVRMNDELLHKPPDSLAKPLCLPFPTSHPYQTHISRYAMFPNFRSPEDRYTGVEASHHQPFHPNIPTNAFDVVVLRKTKGNPYRHEVVKILSDSQKEAVHWPGQHAYFHLPKFAEQKGQIYYPNPPKIVAPNSTFKDLEYNLSPRTTNMLRNSERAQWITTYSQDFTGRGPMNPLNLDDYDMKVLERLTQEIEDMELKETFLPSLSQVRPLQGRTARLLQGRRPRESILQVQHSSNVQMPPLLYSVHTIVPSYSDTMLRKIKATASQQCKVTEDTDQKLNESQEQTHLSQICYQKDDNLDTRPRANEFQKIIDTWQTEALYRRQFAGRSEIEFFPKSVCSLSCKDLKPSHLDQYRVWNNPNSLCMAGSPQQDEKREENGTFIHKLWHQEARQPLWRSEDKPRKTALPECIPSYEVPQHQATLLELQDSFSKTAAHKHFHDSIKGETKDLRDNITEGRRHKFYGFNSFYFYN